MKMLTSRFRRMPFRGAAVITVLLATALPGVGQAQLEAKLEASQAAVQGLYDGNAVTLAECIEVAKLGSATLGKFEEDVESAGVGKTQALAQFLPDLTITGSWSDDERTDVDSPVFGGDLFLVPSGLVDAGFADQGLFQISAEQSGVEDRITPSTSKQVRLSSNWTLFSGFSRFAGLNRAKADLRSIEETYAYQDDLLVQSVSNSYLDYVRARQRVTVAEDAEELARRELERSETYFDLGISTRSDVLQQKVRHQQTKLDTVRERNTMRNAFADLAHNMNIPSARPFDVEDDLTGEMQLPDLDGALVQAATGRSDIAAAQYNVDARTSAVTEARSGYWPSASFFVNWSRFNQNLPQTLRFGSDTTESFSWGFQGSWSIFDRFQTKNQSRNAVATRRKAEYDLQQARLDMELEIVQIHNNLREALERFEVASVTVEQATEDLRLAEERFRVGAGTSLDVINAQVSLAQARRDVVDAKVDYAKFGTQFKRATGTL